nr:extracellular solute-binding protein [Gammaproteobacteria bacterium]
RTVKFTFKDGTNHELPAIVGQLPVLSRAYWEGKDFSKTTLEAPLGSGPYRVTNVDAGRSITYERVKDYWAQDLPVRRGQNNFDRIHYDYYRDQTVALEAFKAGNYDFRRESSSKLWATGYESPALDAGWVKKELIPHSLPAGMQAFIFNTRREIFRDPKVRRALAYAFDFEWTNKTLFYGQYARSNSFFTNSELASSGTPGADELAVLEKYRGKVPDEVFSTAYTPPTTDGSGNLRSNLRKAIKLLKEAGWSIKDKKLTHAKTGKVMAFEMLLVAPAFERIVLPLQKNFERLGIDMKVRTVDQAQYKSRSDDFDFDVIVGNFGITLSPGNEQRDFWHSSKAQLKGSRNLAGVNDPVVDDLIDLIVSAPDREALVTRTKAFDRVLLWSHYVIPNWHTNKFRVAHWDYFGRPEVDPAYALGVMTWWVDDTKKQAVRDARDKN